MLKVTCTLQLTKTFWSKCPELLFELLLRVLIWNDFAMHVYTCRCLVFVHVVCTQSCKWITWLLIYRSQPILQCGSLLGVEEMAPPHGILFIYPSLLYAGTNREEASESDAPGMIDNISAKFADIGVFNYKIESHQWVLNISVEPPDCPVEE